MRKFLTRYRNDFEFRTVVNTTIACTTSLIMSAYYIILAVLSGGDRWWISFAFYSFSLSAIRIILLFSYKTKHNGEDKLFHVKNYVFCGIMIIMLTFALAAVITLIVVRGYHMSYMGYLIYGVALLTFYKICMGIYNIFKAMRDNFTVQAFRSINVADALVSVVSLQAALLAAFASETNTVLSNIVTGTVAAVLIFALGILMIIRGGRILHNTHMGSETENENSDTE